MGPVVPGPGGEPHAEGHTVDELKLLLQPLLVAVPTADESEAASFTDRTRQAASSDASHGRQQHRVPKLKKPVQRRRRFHFRRRLHAETV